MAENVGASQAKAGAGVLMLVVVDLLMVMRVVLVIRLSVMSQN